MEEKGLNKKKTQTIPISKLQFNPFKKFINNGELDEHRLEILNESIEHGTLPEHFIARRYNGIFQLTSGHHRLEALKRAKGKDHLVDVSFVDFSDEQMLIDMCRENLTQRDTEYHDTSDSILLAKRWLQSKVKTVNQFNSLNKTGFHPKGVKGGSESLPDSYRSIAKFLSKNGKTISYPIVGRYLCIVENGIPELQEKVTKGVQGHTEDGKIGIELSAKIASFPKEEQKDLLKTIEQTDLSGEKTVKLLTKYRELPLGIKTKIRKQKIKLEDVEDAVLLDKLEREPKLELSGDNTDFGKYQETYSKLRGIHELRISSFNVGIKYRQELVTELKKAIEHLNSLLSVTEVTEYEKP